MKYEVREWTYYSDNAPTLCGFLPVEVTPAIEQAIVNDIRMHGYVLDDRSELVPVLNTGECVPLDRETIERLVCRAYGFDGETYEKYLIHAENIPHESDAKKFFSDCPMRSIVWVCNESFGELKDEILNGQSNVEIIPRCYAVGKRGDVIRFVREDEADFFEVGVRDYLQGSGFNITDVEMLKNTDTRSILDLIADEPFVSDIPVEYRYAGLSGEKIKERFEYFYANWNLRMIYSGEFDCNIDVVVFDRDFTFTGTVADCPEDIPVPSEVTSEITAKYEKAVEEENRRLEESRQRMLRLKEKMKKKNSSAAE